MRFPHLAYGTPRKLPKPSALAGRVVVLDVAFAAGTGGASFEDTTKPFIDGLGSRLAAWIDHHDHVMHAAYANDDRFVLRTKAQHGACPEMVTPALVQRIGAIDTICCHTDFDGLCSAAKWIRDGEEPYPGADDDARAIDTRMGTPGPRALVLDRALRARGNDDGLKGIIVRFLASGADDKGLFALIEKAAEQLRPREDEARRLSQHYRIANNVAVVDASDHGQPYDKTLLLMLGQERARISVVHDRTTVTVASRFDSGVDLLTLFGLEGGMPTVVSLPISRLANVLVALGFPAE